MNKIIIAIELLKLARIIAKFVKSQKEAEKNIKGSKLGTEKLEYVLEKAQDFLTDNEKELAHSAGFKELSDLAFKAITSKVG